MKIYKIFFNLLLLLLEIIDLNLINNQLIKIYKKIKILINFKFKITFIY